MTLLRGRPTLPMFDNIVVPLDVDFVFDFSVEFLRLFQLQVDPLRWILDL